MSVNVIDDSVPSETAVRNIKDIISSAPKCGDEKDTESQDQEQDMDEQEMSGDKIKDDSVDDDDQEEEQLGLGQDFMREIILKKVRADFPAKFGREPTDEELESYVSGTIQAAGALFGFGTVENEEAEDADEEDADYDPNEDEQQKVADEKEDLADENDLEQELADEADEEDADYDPKEDEQQKVADEEEDFIDEDELEQELEAIDEPLDVDEVDEKELVNSQEFEIELRAAIENVQHIAKLDKEKILSMAKQEYINDTGEEPTQQMVAAAFKMFAIEEDENEIEDENENENEEKNADIEAAEDAELTAEAAEDAELFEKEFGEALENVRELGQAHQKNLVDKICQTFGELHGKQPTPEEMCGIFARIQSKLAEEAMEDFIEKNNASDDVENDSDYEPNEEELKQVEEDKEIEVLEDIVTQTEENEEANSSGDDEEDEEYLPGKDTEDYSKDIDDEIEFENENAIKGSDENEDTSNFIID